MYFLLLFKDLLRLNSSIITCPCIKVQSLREKPHHKLIQSDKRLTGNLTVALNSIKT